MAHPMRRTTHRCVAALTAALLAGLVASAPATGTTASGHPPSGPPDTYVTSWDTTSTDATVAAGFSAPDGHLLHAYVSIAMYDAAMAVREDHEPFAVDENAPDGASAEAAVAAAAHAVLMHYLPATPPAARTLVVTRYGTSLASIPDGAAKTDGIAVGQRVAAALIALRAGDGYRIARPYAAPEPPVPGVWVPTAVTPPLGTYLPHMPPFALRSADQMRPGGPPALGSAQWAAEYAEVQDYGGALSAIRTADQEAAARFWGEPPVPQARAAFRGVIAQHELDLYEASRFLAMMSVTIADSLIACFDAKYTYPFWRPVTAIQRGDTDGNDATVADPTWLPLLGTPNHPEYPSAHSCITPAEGIVIARFFRTSDIDFTVESVAGRPARHFSTPEELAQDVSDARVWGGVHFRSAVEDGTWIAKRTAHGVVAHHFKGADRAARRVLVARGAPSPASRNAATSPAPCRRSARTDPGMRRRSCPWARFGASRR